ncbi:hypothetical protein FH972_017236 [Carpinus fangiana]|uniref:F-box associated beta-propeller type 1 domain-containing protein n=1 Tax=Carpinus fangiana TaxID=176857 RepID=A0A5N6RLV3_9ROSI|nr:hypothetical protein FH972_017236 [Carpinus fangiana]
MGLISLDHHGAFKIETPEIGVENRRMVGSCNALVCLYHGSRNITLWNSATREQRTLPSPRMDNKFYSTQIRAVGFGYHLNDYKVVRIEYSLEGPPVPAKVVVFCTSTASWRVVDAIVPCFLKPHNCLVILKGVPYWLGFESYWKDEMYVRKEFVVCFDMGKEVFRQVHVPDAEGEGSYNDYNKELGVLHQSLAILYYLSDEQVINFVDFWVMKDDECWSKVQRIGPFSNVGIPLGCWKDGVVVWQNGDDDELLLYDPNTKAVNKLSIYGAPGFISTCVFTCMESLIAL